MKIKKIKKYFKIILGTLLIAMTLNLFFVNLDLVPSDIFGFTILFNKRTNMSLALITLLINTFFFTLGYILLSKKEIKKTIIPFVLIPLFIWLTEPISKLIDLESIEMLLLAIYGGVLMGIGYRLIYKEEAYVSATDIMNLILKEIITTKKFILNYFLDCCWLIFAGLTFGLEGAMYSLVSIIIMEEISKRANVGISDSKMFYIITKKDRVVKNYIMNELHYELTMFDVKGGFLETKNKVLLSVIPTKDYYKLKEGIKTIDPQAFISITDSYEVIKNKRKDFNKKITKDI